MSTNITLALVVWAFVVAFCAGCGWAIAHWVVGKLAALIERI